MADLPIDPYLDELAALLDRERSLVVVAEPGAGKTTRLPARITFPTQDRDPSTCGRTWVLQPRRIAAIAAAARVAEELRVPLGAEVGHRVRNEDRTSAATRLEYLTEGMALRKLQSDPFLDGVSTVVFDEFHERSLLSDLLLAFVADVRRQCREDLRIVVMSATMEPRAVAKFLDDAAVREVPGRTFPVAVEYATTVDDRSLEDRTARAVLEELPGLDGAMLVFLPGIESIRRVERRVASAAASAALRVLRLHGACSLAEQREALDPRLGPRVLLATNLAETSLTVPDVCLVVDSGWERISIHDPGRGIDRLQTVPISRHSAEQRAGRAGRVGPGRARRLWTTLEHARRAESRVAEVQRVDLVPWVLELKAWGVKHLADLRCFETPPEIALRSALQRAIQLGALESEDRPLTALGHRLLTLPLAPRLARLVLAAAEFGEREAGCLLAAILESRELLQDPVKEAEHQSRTCDLLDRLERFERARAQALRPAACQAEGLLPGAARQVQELAADLQRRTRSARVEVRPDLPASRSERLRRALLCALPDRVVERRAEDPRRGRMVGGRGVSLARTSAVIEGPHFLAVQLHENDRKVRAEATVSMACAIETLWLEEIFPRAVRDVQEVSYDPRLGRVRATSRRRYEDLDLGREKEIPAPTEFAREILQHELAQCLPAALEKDEHAQDLLRRAEWARQHGAPSLPSLDAAWVAQALADSLAPDDRLPPILEGELESRLWNALGFEQRRSIDACAPTHFELANGRRQSLRFALEGPPVLAVRVQDLFGHHETPRIGPQRVPVLLHILGPNGRPVQVTQDLPSFWNGTYAQVRKDLRARYPKHAWPEDPWNAPPQFRRGSSSKRPSPRGRST